jgi:hypothetical protein
VSPSWRDRVEAYLAPDGVELVRVRRGLRPRSDAGTLVESLGEPGWPASIEALARTLPGIASRGAEVHAAVSNHFVRYAVLPGIDALDADSEREALARHQLQAIHGERAAGWRVALAEHGSRAAGLVAALDAGLLDALGAAVTAAGCSLRSVEPLLAVAFNACRREVVGDAAWLTVAEPERLCIARIAGGSWVEVRNARASRELAAELPAVLEQMRLTAGAVPGPVHLVSREPIDAAIELGAGWHLREVRLGADAPPARRAA